MKSTLALGVVCAFLAMPTFAQQSTELSAQIKRKEAECNAVSTSSRSVNQTISTDAATKASKEAELQASNEKLK